MRLALALALALALVGCLLPGELAAPPPLLDGERVGWFAAHGNMTEAPESTLSLVAFGSFFQAWYEGRDYPTFRATPIERDVVVDNVTASLRLSSTGPVARTARFPDILVYAGSSEAWMGLGTAQTPPVLVPTQEYRFEVPVAVPAGGLWVPAGESFGIKVVVVMHQNEAFDVRLHVGTADGSRANWTQREIASPAWANATTGSDTAQMTGSAYAGDAATGSERYRALVQSNATPVAIFAWMNTTEHDGIPDLDLEMVSPEGDSLASSGTPTPREMLRLGPMHLRGAGDYTLVAASYGSARASATLEWIVLTR